MRFVREIVQDINQDGSEVSKLSRSTFLFTTQSSNGTKIDNDATLSPFGGAARTTEGGGDADPKLSPTFTTTHHSSRLQNSATGHILRFNGEVMQGSSDEEGRSVNGSVFAVMFN